MPVSKKFVLTGFPLAVGLALLSACGPAPLPPGGAINDPHEGQNRAVHEFNRGLDRAIVRPASQVIGQSLPKPVLAGVGRMSSNLSQPGTVINDLLQLRMADAMHNTSRFLINSTIGLLGIFDPASVMGLEERKSDFGQTLHVWGVPEGAYVELPVFGPSTSRDTLGRVVDIVMNPFRGLDVRPANAVRGVNITSRLGDRYRFGETIDSILHKDGNSYARAQSLYLQNRRFELRGDGEPVYFDPYVDPFFNPYPGK
ncbi:MAG: VacJ family lipoprotein [Rhodobacteraceae bacterium]|nr:VacJ family lipoprotein [Paracoccaceae bacterium]